MSEPKSDQESPPSLDELEQRLLAARTREDNSPGGQKAGKAQMSGLGVGMRLATELVAGVAVGTGIGWGIDHLVGSSPWATLGFSVLGWAAGIMNAFRAVKGLDDTVGFGAAVERQQKSGKDDGKGTGGG